MEALVKQFPNQKFHLLYDIACNLKQHLKVYNSKPTN